MPDYIDIPFETDPDDIAAESYDFLQAQIAGWSPAEGNLETVIIDSQARITAETRNRAAQVPRSIFREFGDLVGVPAVEATKATFPSTWTMIDNSGYTIEAGTLVGLRTAGDELVTYEVLIDVVVPPGNIATTAGQVVCIATSAGSESSNLGAPTAPVELQTPLDHVASIVMTAASSGGIDAETDEEYLNHLADRMSLIGTALVLPRDFAAAARGIAGVERALALDGYNPNHNILTPNQSSLETDTTGWSPTSPINVTLTRDTGQFADGVASLRMRSQAAGTMYANTTSITAFTCVPGDRFTALASFKAGTVGRICTISLYWYTAAQAYIGQSDLQGADVTATWTQIAVTATAPANAAFVQIVVAVVGAAAANEDHFLDKIALRRGNSTIWTIGGTLELNNERMISVAAIDELGSAVSVPIKADIDAELQAHREMNFIVHVIDPIYTTVDVTVTVLADTGYTQADVEIRVESAIAQYLNPANWGVPTGGTNFGLSEDDWLIITSVYYWELIALVNNVAGVNRVISMTTGKNGGTQAANNDVLLNGAAPLPLPGVIAATVNLPA